MTQIAHMTHSWCSEYRDMLSMAKKRGWYSRMLTLPWDSCMVHFPDSMQIRGLGITT